MHGDGIILLVTLLVYGLLRLILCFLAALLLLLPVAAFGFFIAKCVGYIFLQTAMDEGRAFRWGIPLLTAVVLTAVASVCICLQWKYFISFDEAQKHYPTSGYVQPLAPIIAHLLYFKLIPVNLPLIKTFLWCLYGADAVLFIVWVFLGKRGRRRRCITARSSLSAAGP